MTVDARATREVVVVLPVRKVVVLEDRANVERSGRVSVDPGRTRLVVEGLAPVAVDKSLAVELGTPVDGVRVTGARIVRTPIERRVEASDDDLRRATDALEVHEGRLRRMTREAYDTNRLLVSMLDEAAEDAAWARAMTADRREGYQSLVARSRKLAETIAAAQVEIDEERRAVERKQKRNDAAERPDLGVAARLEIDVEAGAVAEINLRAGYLVPNACWRPRHRATLRDVPKTVLFETEGVVWQNTGEDWNGVDLALSTERASLGTAIPELEADRLSTRKKGPLVVEVRQEQIHEAGLGAGVVVEKIQEMPGIDDGGEARHLRPKSSADVPSDGRPHAVPIASFEGPVAVELLVVPELVEAAVTKTTFTNAGGAPLLAGPVELVRRGGAVGRATIGFVAVGEKIAIGWGPEPAISVHREVEHKKDESNLLGSWTTLTHDVFVHVANLGREPRAIVVKERVAISEVEKVKVELVAKETTGGKEPDENGIVTFDVELAPRAKKTIKLRVVTKKPADVG